MALGISGLGLIFSMTLEAKNGIQSLKSSLSISHSELKAHIPPYVEGYNIQGTHVNRFCVLAAMCTST